MKIRLILVLIFTISFASGQDDKFTSMKNLYNKGKFYEVIEQSTLAIRDLSPSDSMYRKLLRLRAGCFMAKSNFKSAIEDYSTLIQIDSNDVSYFVGLSFAYWALNDNENCIKSIFKAYELDPKDIGTLNNMSYFYGQAGRYVESIKFANEGIKQSVTQNNLKDAFYNNRGFAYLGLKQYEKATADINQAIKINPQNSYAYFYRALVNIEIKKMENVCQDLEKSKSLGGTNLTKDLIDKYCKK